MKKTLLNYAFVFLVLLVCLVIFHISFDDYVDIKYFFPSKSIYIAISILVNYYYLKIILDSVLHYIEIDVLSLIRIGKKELYIILISKIVRTIILFCILSISSDILLYRNLSVEGLICTLIIEIILGMLIILTYKKLKTNTFIVALLLCILIRGTISILINNNVINSLFM